jgi:hypothetical protein
MAMPGYDLWNPLKRYSSAMQGGASPADPKKKKPYFEREGMFGLDKGTLMMGGLGLLAGNRNTGPQMMLQSLAHGMNAQGERRKEAERQAKMDKFKQGLTPEQAMLFDVAPNAVAGGMAQEMFAKPAKREIIKGADGYQYYADNGQRVLADVKAPGKAPATGMIQDETGNWVYDPDYLTGQERLRAAGRDSVSVSVGADGGRYKSLAEVPVGQPVPLDLLPIPESKIPEDRYPVRADNGAGFSFEVIPGSTAESKAESRNNPTTIDSLIGSYATLNKNKAIRSQQNSAGENFGAMFSKTPPGRFVDALGGDVGNADNDTARDNIEGISMNMLMKMISMSDVSARAMDSDAEMKAWLGAIKGDQYESALTKLHVLDTSFGSGQALERAYANNQIDRDTYLYVTQRANTDPMAVAMKQRMQQYAALEESVGNENLTDSERQELEELRAWQAQNGG